MYIQLHHLLRKNPWPAQRARTTALCFGTDLGTMRKAKTFETKAWLARKMLQVRLVIIDGFVICAHNCKARICYAPVEVHVITVIVTFRHFAAHDELGACRANPVSAEQSVLNTSIQTIEATILPVTRCTHHQHWTSGNLGGSVLNLTQQKVFQAVYH